ncbi:MAG: hypothetical protein L6R48_13540, partial [Planctomycetes bacterium]|nr:hypothetical protein [Planctomycetota bacterium]
IPFQAEGHNKPTYDSTSLYSGMNWHSDAAAPVAGWAEGRVRLTHRGKAVVTWIDGRSVARNRSQLEGEDGILGAQQMP